MEVHRIEQALPPEACEYLIDLIKTRLRPSTITTADTEPDQYFRTSSTCDLNFPDPVLEAIEMVLADLVPVRPSWGEPLQGQHYAPGQEFKAHCDSFSPADIRRYGGQRTWTVMVYLNDVEKGGHTTFPRLDLDITPKTGMAVVWNNLDADGTPNPLTLHHATPVEAGEKVVITKWYRDRPLDSPAVA